jgi:hypothetical protein
LAASSGRGALNHAIAMKVLAIMSRRDERSVDDFEARFEEWRRSRSTPSSPGTAPWTFFVPFRIKLASDLKKSPTITVLGKKFRFITRVSALRQLGKQTFEQPSDSIWAARVSPDNIPDAFVTIEGRGDSHHAAWKAVEPAFETLRGLLEFSFGFGGWRISTDQRARRKVPAPEWLIARQKGIAVEGIGFATEDQECRKLFELTATHLAILKRRAKLIRQQPEPQTSVSVIADALRLYSQAMDARFSYSCFLGLWQMAETIAMSEDEGGQTDRVVSKIAWHGEKLKLHGSGWTNALGALGEKRNDIVHRGIREIEDLDVNILKLACETSLAWLVQEAEALPAKCHLREFYRLRNAHPTVLDACRCSAEYVLAKRKKGNIRHADASDHKL